MQTEKIDQNIRNKEGFEEETPDKDKENRVKRAKELITVFDKTIKTYKLFAKNHQNRERARTELFTKFNSFLEEFQKLPLNIRAFEFLYEGEIVYSNTDVSESYSFKFFQDGFRNITFNAGLTIDELNGFIDVIVIDFGNIEFQDESPATLIWKKNLAHVDYTIVETFADLNPEELKKLKEEMNRISDTITSPEYKREKDKKSGRTKGVEQKIRRGAFFQAAGALLDTEKSQEIVEKEILSLTAEDQDRLKLFKRAKNFLNTQKFVQILIFIITEEEKDSDPFNNAISMLNHLVDHLININEIKWVVSIFYKIRELKESAKSKVADLFEKLITEERIETIINKLNSEEIPPNFDLLRFFMLSIRETRGHLFFDSLTKVINKSFRRKISELLVDSAKDNLRTLEYRMQQSSDVDFILEMIFILNKINSTEAIDIVMDLKNHQDKTVRLELVRANAERLDDVAKRLFIHMIKDEAPEIRVAALSLLANFNDIEVDLAAAESVKSPEFHKKSLDEKKKHLLIVAKSEDPGISSLPEKFLKKRFTFDKNVVDTMGCAVLVLGLLQKSEYLPLLKRISRGFLRPKPLKMASEFAIKTIEGAR